MKKSPRIFKQSRLGVHESKRLRAGHSFRSSGVFHQPEAVKLP